MRLGSLNGVGRSILNLLLLLFAVLLFAFASAVAQVLGAPGAAPHGHVRDYVETRFEERIDEKGE